MRDVTCWRNRTGAVECSPPQRHAHHPPGGFETGYGGSGPADLALTILALAIGGPPDPRPEPSEDSDVVAAWDLRKAFKRELIATMPREGGVLAGVVIDTWVAARRHARDTDDPQGARCGERERA
jgi:hypothetical protein